MSQKRLHSSNQCSYDIEHGCVAMSQKMPRYAWKSQLLRCGFQALTQEIPSICRRRFTWGKDESARISSTRWEFSDCNETRSSRSSPRPCRINRAPELVDDHR